MYQSANGIINKPVATSYLSVNPSGMANVKMNDTTENANKIEYWHEMECRLQYMQAQVSEENFHPC